MFGALLREHELIYLLNHIKVLMKNLSLVHDTFRYPSTQVFLLLDHITDFHL
jgi:hypothetical protein